MGSLLPQAIIVPGQDTRNCHAHLAPSLALKSALGMAEQRKRKKPASLKTIAVAESASPEDYSSLDF